MGWLNAISIANRETRQVESDERARETSIRNLHRMRQQDADAQTERERQASAKAAYAQDTPDFLPLDQGSGYGVYNAPATPAAAPQAPAATGGQQAQVQRLREMQMRARNPSAGYTPDQSAAETARLSRAAPARRPSALEANGYDNTRAFEAVGAPQRAAVDRQKQLQRRTELARLNPSRGVTPDQSAAESDRVLRQGTPGLPTGGFDAFKGAIFGQESRNGAVDTSKPNYAGALGKGQILESTFNGLKQQGKIPANFEWRNPEHNAAAAEAYMQEAWQAAGGDPRMAAAYYYGGPKAIAGGKINTYRDLKNPRAPDTNQYADQVLSRMGRGAQPALPAGERPAPTAVAQASPQPAPAGAAPTAAPGLPMQQVAAMPGDVVGGRGTDDGQSMRILRMKMNELRARMPYAKTAEDAQAIRGQMAELAAGAQEIQVRNAAGAALEDNNALTSLARMASAPFAQAAEGFVLVRPDGQGNWKPASQPVDRATLVTHLVSVLTGSGAAAAAEQRKADNEIRKAVVVEQVKGTNAAREASMKHQFNLQEEMQKYDMSADDFLGVETNPNTGQQIVRTKRGMFSIVPGVEVNGMMTNTTMRPIAVQ